MTLETDDHRMRPETHALWVMSDIVVHCETVCWQPVGQKQRLRINNQAHLY